MKWLLLGSLIGGCSERYESRPKHLEPTELRRLQGSEISLQGWASDVVSVRYVSSSGGLYELHFERTQSVPLYGKHYEALLLLHGGRDIVCVDFLPTSGGTLGLDDLVPCQCSE